jgi:hypothetical protein
MIADIHGGLPWRIGVVAGASPVFLLAFAATMYDMLATTATHMNPGSPVPDIAADTRDVSLAHPLIGKIDPR